MGTRLYCDHCGNTVTRHNKLGFGDVKTALSKADQRLEDIQSQQTYLEAIHQAKAFGDLSVMRRAMQNIGVASGQVQSAPNSPPAKPSIGIFEVELCDNCVPIWMERVKNLCSQSDTDV